MLDGRAQMIVAYVIECLAYVQKTRQADNLSSVDLRKIPSTILILIKVPGVIKKPLWFGFSSIAFLTQESRVLQITRRITEDIVIGRHLSKAVCYGEMDSPLTIMKDSLKM